MHPRKIIEIAIYPKVFNVLSFYSKGQYAISISVGKQQADGRIIPAYPTMMAKSSSELPPHKRPSLNINQNSASFISEQFYISFNEETIMMNTVAIFKLELDPEEDSQIHIDFDLCLNKIKKNKGENQEEEQHQHQRYLKKMDHRRLHVKKMMELDHFKRVVFSECQFFSFLDVYVGVAYLGTRFRIKQHELFEFSNLESKTKANMQCECLLRKLSLNDQDRNQHIKRITNLSISQFRGKYGAQTHSSYLQIRRRLQYLAKLGQTNNSVLWLNDSTINQILTNQIHYDTLLKNKQQLIRLYDVDEDQLFLTIYKQIAQHDLYNMYVWRKFLTAIQRMPIRIFTILSHKHLLRENTFKEIHMVTHGKIHKDIRTKQQKVFVKRRKQALENLVLCEDDDVYHPLFMIDGFQKVEVASKPLFQVTSLVVFVHGYQGSDYDLEKAKNFMTIYAPNSHGLLIKTIQDDIDENLEHLGAKLASQIKTHIAGSFNDYKKISLVGYSLGGVIARESLQYLSEYKDKMNLLITFASPHLGVSRSDNSLVGTGIWYLINISKVKNLKQLNCERNQNQEITLMKLSQCQGLSWFKKIVLVSSKQDNFVPHYSSRIDPEVVDEPEKSMADNIISRAKKIQRVELWFDVEHNINTFDKILGRRAHIEFLENRIFLDIFFRLYSSQL